MKKSVILLTVMGFIMMGFSAKAVEQSAQLSPMQVRLDGQSTSLQGYLISDENYFKLRDIAFVMNGKPCNFNVKYDHEGSAILLDKHSPYTTATGAELEKIDAAKVAAKPSTQSVMVDNTLVDLEKYNINSYTYFRLRDIGQQIGFGVEYDSKTNTVLLSSQINATIDPESGAAHSATAPLQNSQPVTGVTDVITASDSSELPETSIADDPEQNTDNPTLTETVSEATSSASTEPEDTMPVENPVSNADTTEDTSSSKIDGKLVILLDAGHGGNDPGSSSLDGTYNENWLNMEVARCVEQILTAQGVQVIMLRTEDDTSMNVNRRKMILKESLQDYPIDLCVSVHHNASKTHKVSGSEVLMQVAYENGGIGQQLARTIENAYANIGRKVRPTVYRHSDISYAKDYYYFLKMAYEADTLAFISEFCYLDHPDDLPWVTTEAGWNKEAEALSQGILNFYQTHLY